MMMVTVLCGCGRAEAPALQRYSETRSLMATVIQVDVCVDTENDVHQSGVYPKIWKRLEEIAWRMNVYDERSDVTRINQAGTNPIEVPADTYEIIRRSKEFAQKTRGTFLISIRPLIDVWKTGQQNDRLPTPDMIRQTLESIDLDDLKLHADNRISRHHPQLKLDLGGNAKGYAVDEVARLFREHGFQHFYIDAGGDIYVGGKNCQGKSWRIGIRDPRDKSRLIETVVVSNAAVTTSGNYEQTMAIQGERYSHIIDPRTGYPQRDVVSATVIAASAEEADVYSTALTVLGADEGVSLIESLGQGRAALVFTKRPGGQLERAESSSMPQYRNP